MTDLDIMLGVLAVSIAVLMLVPDWRPAFASLCVCGVLLLVFEQRELLTLGGATASSILTLLNAVDGVSLLCVALIVLFTGLTYSRTDQGQADEVGKLHLRHAARQAARAAVPRGWDAYRTPLVALVLLVAGAPLLPLFYPAPPHAGVYAWTLLLLGGILVAATSDTLLKLGMGLLLISFGLRLCYLTQAATVGFFELTLFSFVPIVVALVVALLSSLQFSRLGTLRLALLFEQARPAPAAVTKPATATTEPAAAKEGR